MINNRVFDLIVWFFISYNLDFIINYLHLQNCKYQVVLVC